jgi:hypothetical protein
MGPPTAGRATNCSRRKAFTSAAMSLGFVVVQLDVTVVNVAVKSIGTASGASVAGLQWVVNAYTIAFAALILTAGAAGDDNEKHRLGRGHVKLLAEDRGKSADESPRGKTHCEGNSSEEQMLLLRVFR